MSLPFVLDTDPLPKGEVSTAVAREILELALKRPVKRHELLHLKIDRVSSVDPENRDQPVRVTPSGSTGARGAQLWTFADVARLATILGLSRASPQMRAGIWVGLGDPVLGGMVAYIDGRVPQIEADKNHHVLRIKAARPEHYVDSLIDVFTGIFASQGHFNPEDLLVIGYRFDRLGFSLMPETWKDYAAVPKPDCLPIDVTTPTIKALFAWREYHGSGG